MTANLAASHPHDGRSGGETPLLPLGSLRSVVTINNPPLCVGVRSKHERRGSPFNLCSSRPRPSVAISSFICNGSEGNGGERTTLVATCTTADGNDVHDEDKSRNGRISLATIAETPRAEKGHGPRVLGMQYSSNNAPSFSTVCIAPIRGTSQGNGDTTLQPPSILLATDRSGRLYTCALMHGENKQHPLDMQECIFTTDFDRDTPKRGKRVKSSTKSTEKSDGCSQPPLRLANTVTARLGSALPVSQPSSPSKSPKTSSAAKSPTRSSPTKGKGRKRKLSPSKKSASLGDTSRGATTQSDAIYVVASNMNQCIPVSQSPPVVMLLSETNEPRANHHCSGLAWSKIPGLEEDAHTPMTCILFAARSKVGPQIWKGILSAIESNSSAEALLTPGIDDDGCDASVVLMGFQDGTVRASVVVAQSCASDGSTSVSLAVSNATTVLQLSANEPLVSLNLMPLASNPDTSSLAAPTLLCVGALGTIATLSTLLEPGKPAKISKFAVQQSLKPRGGRWVSMECIGHRFLEKNDSNRASSGDSPNVVSFVGVDDLGQTFLHHLILRQPTSSVADAFTHGGEYSSHRLPVSAQASSSVHCHPDAPGIFAMSSPNGKVVVLSVSASEMASLGKAGLQHRPGDPLSTRSCPAKEEPERINSSGSTTLESLIQQLKSATVKQIRNDAGDRFDAVNAMKEIRSASQMAALMSKPSSPMRCEFTKMNPQKPGIVGGRVINAGTTLTSQQTVASWLPSVHILQSCLQAFSPMLRPESIDSIPPLCYRRAPRGDGKPTIVVYGGTATSCSASDFRDNIDDSSRRLSFELGLNDLTPASVYASLSTVYTGLAEEDPGWSKSSRAATYPRHRATTEMCQPELFSLMGSAKSCFQVDFLGASLPFEIDAEVDILAHAFNSDQSAVSTVGGEKGPDPRDTAEMLVRRQYQNQSSQGRSTEDHVIPLFKEMQWIRSFRNHGITDDSKVHCCSSSMRSTVIQANGQNDCCANVGLGALSVACRNSGVGFAVGSDVLSPNEAMALLPLIRQAILRRGVKHPSLNMMDLYCQQLHEKQAAKLTKYISRSSEELLERIGDSSEDECKVSSETLAAALSLYELWRTINIAF